MLFPQNSNPEISSHFSQYTHSIFFGKYASCKAEWKKIGLANFVSLTIL